MRHVVALLGLTLLMFSALVGAAHAGAVVKTPEPASMTVLAVGAGVVALVKFRKRK
jgi:hypothetical protein